MKTFIFSFLLTVSVIIYFNLPAAMARPIDIIPRLIFYIAFPTSVFVGMLLITLMEVTGLSRTRVDIDPKKVVKPAMA